MWEELVARPDVSPSPSAAAYLRRAKGLRMLALSEPLLRPNLQRDLWSRVMLDVFASLVEAGVALREDFAAFNSDEIFLHADTAQEALSKVELFRSALDVALPQWSHALAYSAFGLEALPLGFKRTCLLTGRSSFKCMSPQLLATHCVAGR